MLCMTKKVYSLKNIFNVRNLIETDKNKFGNCYEILQPFQICYIWRPCTTTFFLLARVLTSHSCTVKFMKTSNHPVDRYLHLKSPFVGGLDHDKA